MRATSIMSEPLSPEAHRTLMSPSRSVDVFVRSSTPVVVIWTAQKLLPVVKYVESRLGSRPNRPG